MNVGRPTLLDVVASWWEWSPEEVSGFKTWATTNRDQATAWLNREVDAMSEYRRSGVMNVIYLLKT